MLVKIGKYIGFCVYRRSYLLWSPVILPGRTYWYYFIFPGTQQYHQTKLRHLTQHFALMRSSSVATCMMRSELGENILIIADDDDGSFYREGAAFTPQF